MNSLWYLRFAPRPPYFHGLGVLLQGMMVLLSGAVADRFSDVAIRNYGEFFVTWYLLIGAAIVVVCVAYHLNGAVRSSPSFKFVKVINLSSGILYITTLMLFIIAAILPIWTLTKIKKEIEYRINNLYCATKEASSSGTWPSDLSAIRQSSHVAGYDFVVPYSRTSPGGLPPIHGMVVAVPTDFEFPAAGSSRHVAELHPKDIVIVKMKMPLFWYGTCVVLADGSTLWLNEADLGRMLKNASMLNRGE